MSKPTHSSEATEKEPKGLFHGLVTGPITTSVHIPMTPSTNIAGNDTVEISPETDRRKNPASFRSSATPQSKQSILSRLFTPAPDPQEEPKLLFDEDIRMDDQDASNNLNQISSTEASIQSLNLPPVPDDGGPHMLFEKESVSRAK
ncbi:hypothetical protein FisN_28Hu088 [Fistulifera solaris]|uniref:Uncharacterized protein n=1 Tax=Fistulifera solaris TaxID=1519565 RepID=A0A1Z5KH28_FISSO|nr:hypothetical protein FisN_28Hu088 [Fistulifera solaris]|eukprot:GAX25613.1 hypothetical protein FisN_28Hu088 [Fistulifera solaris]